MDQNNNYNFEDIQSRILYEDNHIIIINKYPGELVQKDITKDQTLSECVKLFLKEKYNKPGNVFLGIPHRLDRPTSGTVVFAKTDKALSRMNNMFRDGSIKKIYWAITDGTPQEPSGLLTSYIVRNSNKNKSFSFSYPRKDAKEAKLRYRVIGKSINFFLIEIELLTGRHHQIRSQLAQLGIHIKGDLKYGFPRSNKDGGIHLHSRRIIFTHPVSETTIDITAPVPKNDTLWMFFQENHTL